MRKLPPRRFALEPPPEHQFGTTAEEAEDAAFAAQLREANLKLPIKDKMRELAMQMQQHLDAELQKAVERFLDMKVTDPLLVKGRLTHIHPPAGDATFYCMDGVPVLKAGPQVLERRDDAIHAFQLVEQLLPEDLKPASRIILP